MIDLQPVSSSSSAAFYWSPLEISLIHPCGRGSPRRRPTGALPRSHFLQPRLNNICDTHIIPCSLYLRASFSTVFLPFLHLPFRPHLFFFSPFIAYSILFNSNFVISLSLPPSLWVYFLRPCILLLTWGFTTGPQAEWCVAVHYIQFK